MANSAPLSGLVSGLGGAQVFKHITAPNGDACFVIAVAATINANMRNVLAR
jgi:hypothetical protein